MGLGGPATNQIADESVSEDHSSPPRGEDSWAATDTEDDLASPQNMVVSVGGANFLSSLVPRPIFEISSV